MYAFQVPEHCWKVCLTCSRGAEEDESDPRSYGCGNYKDEDCVEEAPD